MAIISESENSFYVESVDDRKMKLGRWEEARRGLPSGWENDRGPVFPAPSVLASFQCKAILLLRLR